MDRVVEQFASLSTTCVSDAMDGLNNLDPGIKPVKEELKVAGRAVTVKVRAADNVMVLKAIGEAQPGDVVVVDGKGYLYNGLCGDFVIGLARTLGLGGIVIDGAVRDIRGIKALNFPVFCRGTTVAASGKSGSGEVNVPISCGGTVIRPGDIIIGDADGVVVVPKEQEEQILEKAKEKLKKDEEREKKIIGNPEAAREYIARQVSGR